MCILLVILTYIIHSPSIAEVKNERSYTSAPPYMQSWCELGWLYLYLYLSRYIIPCVEGRDL